MENKTKDNYYSSVNKLKKEFYKSVKEKYNLRQQDCFDIFDDVISTLIESIYANEETKIRGFGTFKVNERYTDKPKRFSSLKGKDKGDIMILSNRKVVTFVPSRIIVNKLNTEQQKT